MENKNQPISCSKCSKPIEKKRIVNSRSICNPSEGIYPNETTKRLMKTNPIGVRFDTELIELMELKLGIKTPQKILNYLSNRWLTEECVEVPPTETIITYPIEGNKDVRVILGPEAQKFMGIKPKKDYQAEFNNCEFPEEYKALWEKIKDDAGLNEKDKALWKIRLNVK